MPTDVQRIEGVFLAAAEIGDPADRAKFLDGACDSDAELRSRVEALLRAHDQPDSLLDHPAVVPHDPESAITHTIGREGGAATDDEPLTFLAPPRRPDSLGRLGHYEVLQLLGKGGFGIVFRAFDEMLQRVVALKVMAPQLAATSPARKRFLREAQSSAKVRHENVVQVHEVAEQPLPYLVMEFIPGETLQQKLDRTGPLDVPEVLRIGRQIAEGLAAAHATNLIHRDIKPGNVLLESGQQKVKITDFGLARTADDASISQSGLIAGTPMYMAPEQALGQTLDQRADLFSLGSVLYQMAAGRPPFRASSAVAVLKRVAEDTPRDIRDIIPETPQWLCDIIAKLHAKNPDERYQSARDVADVLADCEAQFQANARLKDYSRIPRGKPQRAARWKWVTAAAAVLLPVIALAVTEIAGVTHLFRAQPANSDPLNNGSAPTADPLPKQGGSDSEGWVQLFNGEDLTGWRTHPDMPGNWAVEGGSIVGRGSKMGYLFSSRGDFRDFHLRFKTKLNAAGDSSVFFRCPFGFPFRYGAVGVPGGFDADFRGEGAAIVAGRLLYLGAKPLLTLESVPADTWFTYEIIAAGDRLVLRVNGQTTAVYRDPERHFTAGHFALQTATPQTVVYFREIEIKELPPSVLTAGEKVEEVRKELKRRNPDFDGKMDTKIDFDGKMGTKIEDGVVTELTIVTDQVTDIAPIRVFDALRVLQCRGTYPDNGLLADLTPLEGMNLAALTYLNLSSTQVGDAGMVCFKDCKNLTHLDLFHTQVGDAGLFHFKNCKALTHLFMGDTKVGDVGLAHLKDCKNLNVLWAPDTQIGDAGLAYVQDCKALTTLNLGGTKVSDVGLAHLKDCKNLKHLYLDRTPVGDAGLGNFRDFGLTELHIDHTAITDLMALQGMPLKDIRLTPKNITRGLDILRAMQSLKTIGIAKDNQAWPAAKFWERYDKGEFKE
jgi:serine/threonine protein kinase